MAESFTLRDLFASGIIGGLLQSTKFHGNGSRFVVANAISLSRRAYDFTDAILRERESDDEDITPIDVHAVSVASGLAVHLASVYDRDIEEVIDNYAKTVYVVADAMILNA